MSEALQHACLVHRWGQASYPRRELCAHMVRAARRNWLPLVGAASIITLGAIPATLAFNGYARGLIQGLIVGFAASALSLVLLLASGGSRHLMGAWGEENTRDELRRLRRRGVIVDWVDDLAIDGGDVDHLVLTRGGVVAIDSKYHAPLPRGSGQWRRDAQAAARAARRASLILRAEKCPLPVTPVVVVWGGAQGQVGGDRVVDGVRILPREHLQAWLSDHAAAETLSEDEAREIAAKLRGFRARVRPPARSRTVPMAFRAPSGA